MRELPIARLRAHRCGVGLLSQRPLTWLVLVWCIALVSAFLPTVLWAQDVMPGRQLAVPLPLAVTATGPRTSPFKPPTQDVFLTDAAAGLDTGCIFNSNPLNPLTINILVDRFVGDVDANGYLVNPTPLISAGIIPASVDLILPAFDIDYTGAAPPERDELLFNGQSLGFLTGDNNIWKLNTFRLDVRRIKFPARPAPGAALVPASNRVQIKIDVLSVNRWCMQVDWVALLLPVRPKLALDLDVVAGNPVTTNAGAPITRILEQRFDAACHVTQTVGAIGQYPFSGPALSGAGGTGTARLRATIKACPDGSLGTPEVRADWSIGGTSRRGSTTWNGGSGTVEFTMPDAVGAYDATLDLTVNGSQSLSAVRRLYVTRRAPAIAENGVFLYEKATSWANGQVSDTGVIEQVMAGVYNYGGAAWRYGYFGPAPNDKCSWIALMANPLACNYSDCYVFSDVLENMAGLLGVGGLVAIKEVGSLGLGFLTNGAPSLDPAFRGNAKPLGGAGYDRYLFSSHSLRLRGGVYYDATFNGRYATQNAFIFANRNTTAGVDAAGSWRGTVEGRRTYRRGGSVYDSWGRNDYAFLDSFPFAPLAALAGGVLVPTAAAAGGVNFPGTARYRPVDADRDGRYEHLAVDVDVDVIVPGSYGLLAQLESAGGLLIANRPADDSMLESGAEINAATAGRYTATVRFSGEQIRRAGIDGPWRVLIDANGETSAAGSTALTSPAFRAADFGERKLTLQSLQAIPVDADGSGRYELIRVSAQIDAKIAGNVRLRVNALGGGIDLASQTRTVALALGQQSVVVDLPAAEIARSGRDAPYDISLTVADLAGATLDAGNIRLVGLLAAQFESTVRVSGSLVEQLIDSDGNGLYDLLRVSADLRSPAARDVTIQARLVATNGAIVEASAAARLTPASQRISFDFPGALIRRQLMSSQYRLELSFRTPSTLQEMDAAAELLRGTYVYTQFDSGEPARTVSLTGTRSEVGFDTNGNGLFDSLRIDLGIETTVAGSYQWSGRLVDRNGQELGFASNSGSLVTGRGTLALQFGGRPIGVNGLDGPYFLRSLLVAGPNGANLVSPFAGETSALLASQFEGYVARLPGDINGDGVVDARDVEAFNRALGTSLGDANFNRFADLDRDGRVTLNDLRLLRSLLPRR